MKVQGTLGFVAGMVAVSICASLPSVAGQGPMPAREAVTAAGTIAANDNRRPAGALAGNVLTVRLFAGVGKWRPEGDAGRTVSDDHSARRRLPRGRPRPART